MDIQFAIIITSALFVGFLFGRFFHSSYKSSSTSLSANCSGLYIQGLNYLLANKSDKAIELFVDLVKVDKETIETHLALGNLFRSKGEVDRAIKIHQNLIARPNLDQNQRVMALSELAEDYHKAGLLDRAENLFKELVQINPKNVSAQRRLFELYCVEKAWSDALHQAQCLFDLGEHDGAVLLTHCFCELAEQCLNSGNSREASELLKKATEIDSKCIRALLLQIDVHLKNNELAKSTRILNQLVKSAPQFIELYLKPAREIYLNRGSTEQYQSFLTLQYRTTASNMVAVELLKSYQATDQHEVLISFLQQAIQQSASFELYDFAFRYFRSRPHKFNEACLGLTSQFMAIKGKPVAFVCNGCGYESQAMQWNCPSCNTWSSLRPV